MLKTICRNIAIVSAAGIFVFAIMLVTNYFQARQVNPLQIEVMETLRQVNDAHADNTVLQEQIRQLDLLARRAYFSSLDHLKIGVYILIGMAVVFFVSLHLYRIEQIQVPDKQVSPIDDWIEKTHARRYVSLAAGALALIALSFAIFSAPLLGVGSSETPEPKASDQRIPAANATVNGFRGMYSNGKVQAGQIPVFWNPETDENIAWKSTVAKPGYNSPVIAGEKIFLSGADNEARELYCYDLNTGNLLWTLKAENIQGSPTEIPKTTSDTGLAAPTVATNGQQVCAIFATGDLICADMDGNRLWATNLGVPENHYGYASSLLAYDDMVIIQYDNTNSPQIIALTMADGQERWRINRPDKITWSSPAIATVADRHQLIVMGNPYLTAYDPSDGKQLWQVDGLSGEVASSPCSAGNRVFGASEYAELMAVDATTGEKLWTAGDFLPEVSSPVATDSCVFLATSYGVFACYDAANGQLLHSHELNTEFYSSPMLVDGKIYLFSNSGQVYIFSADADCKLLHSFETGQHTFATPAFVDGTIIVRSVDYLYRVSHHE